MSELLSDALTLKRFLAVHPICALYFSAPDCAVCGVLKPKLIAMLTQEFPKIGVGEVDCALSPSLAAAYSVFTVPSLIIFTEGRESLRKSRSFGLTALAAELERPYSLLYGGR